MSISIESGAHSANNGGHFTKVANADHGLAYLRRNNHRLPPLVRKSDATIEDEKSLFSVMGMLGRIGFGYVVLDDHMRVIDWNEPAKATLEVCLNIENPKKAVADAFKELTSRTHCRLMLGGVFWIVVPHKGGTPLVFQDKAVVGHYNSCIVLLLSRETCPHPNPLRLQQLFGLTEAETQLATSLVSGMTPLEIASRSKLSRSTIRSQLAALFLKTDTKRQSELVALLGHVSVLP
jgi:DNA-binding CsgD family transcriptional regulator